MGYCLLITVLLSFLFIISAKTPVNEEWKEIKKILDREGDYLLSRPTFDGVKLVDTVFANVIIKQIDSVNYKDMTMMVQMFLNLSWNDTRLYFKTEKANRTFTMPHSDRHSLWYPDLFIENSVASDFQPEQLFPDVYITITPRGTISSGHRITSTLRCAMNMFRYPFDAQICSIRMSSYAHVKEDMMFHWRQKNTLALSDDFYLPQYYISANDSQICTSQTKTGVYSCLEVKFMLRRENWMVNTNIVQAIIVISVSWLVFWFTSSPMPCRFGFLVFCSSIQCWLMYKSVDLRPEVSYLTALDIWNIICFFTCILEMLFLLKISHTSPDTDGEPEPKKHTTAKECLVSFLKINNLTASIVFPVCFYAITAVYFAVFLPGFTGSSKDDYLALQTSN